LGMGLAISRSIIEAHGGWLGATANEPRGAVFQFALPSDGIIRNVRSTIAIAVDQPPDETGISVSPRRLQSLKEY
jgi:light-regulated signal transduction histidine kinase (bacteriophytochrome)